MSTLLTPDEYVQLLVQRRNAAHTANREEHTRRGLARVREWIRPLPERMIRDGGQLLVNMAALTARM